jgi:hypothetical protein
VVPDFALSATGDQGRGQAVVFTVEYECSHTDALTIVRDSRAPLVVVRGGTEKPATYFIYSWDESAGQVTVHAAADNIPPLRQVPPLAEHLPAHDSAISG